MENTNKKIEQTIDQITTDDVAQYLRENPDFFHYRDDLLAQLEVPHHSGSAVSLVEKQMEVLRTRNMHMLARLSHMLDAARENDRLFEKSRNLVLELLDVTDLEELAITVEEHIKEQFEADHCTMVIVSMEDDTDAQLKRVTEITGKKKLGGLLENSQPVCGKIRDEELNFLFPNDHGIKSVAIIPMRWQDGRGILAIGSHDADRFRAGIGTLFLGYIGDILQRLLPRFLADENRG